MTIVAHAPTELCYALPVPLGGSGVQSVDLLTVTLETSEGHTGFGFSYVIGGADDLPLAALGGLTPCLRLARSAAAHGIGVRRARATGCRPIRARVPCTASTADQDRARARRSWRG